MPRKKLERISLTIDKSLLSRLDSYVELNKTVKDISRSSIISDLVKTYIPS